VLRAKSFPWISKCTKLGPLARCVKWNYKGTKHDHTFSSDLNHVVETLGHGFGFWMLQKLASSVTCTHAHHKLCCSWLTCVGLAMTLVNILISPLLFIFHLFTSFSHLNMSPLLRSHREISDLETWKHIF
jgi:hypothetical protein